LTEFYVAGLGEEDTTIDVEITNSRKLFRKSVDLPNNHSRGGQSQNRIARLRDEAIHNYITKLVEAATQHFIISEIEAIFQEFNCTIVPIKTGNQFGRVLGITWFALQE